MSYKLAAIDLDDTFINDNHEFTPNTIEAVQKSIEKGVQIVLASGRTYRGLKAYYDQLNLTSPVITCGGAIVTDCAGNPLFTSLVSHDLAKKVMEYGEANHVHTQVYFGDNFVFRKSSKYSKIYEDFYGFPGVVMPDLMECSDLRTPKVLFIAEPEKIKELQAEAENLFPELLIATSKPFYLEFNNPNANKGTALKFLTDYLGLKREEVIAIGDSEIDLSMIEYAGLGVAMENGLAHVKECADFITYSNEEDGVAHVLEKFILEE